MKNYFVITLVAICTVACTNPKEKLFKEIKTLEQSDTMGTPEGLEMLAKLHKEYGLTYTDSLANNYLYSAAMFYFYSKDKAFSKPLFLEFIKRGDSSDRQRNSYFSLASIYSDEEQYDSFELVTKILVKQYIPSTQQWSNLANMYARKMENSPTTVADYESLSLAYTAMGGYDLAVEALDSAMSKFPNSPSKADILYRAGFLAWDYLEDHERAKSYYNELIKLYPEHEMVPQTRKILESGMIEMSDDKILEMLKANGA